ncbi:ATP phosphoribosyltransferase [Natranaerobius thermophilus]|nr:ATP phosphoribosyltransferase [Natranaerobius thermophilus]
MSRMRTGEQLTIALPKGRILDESVKLLEQAGIACDQVNENGRKLIFTDQEQSLSFILGKPMDVPTYVEHGAADIGIVGKDVIEEVKGEYYELLDMKMGYCKMVLAREKSNETFDINSVNAVATKYPQITQEYFQEFGRQVKIIKLNGSVELAPLIGLSDTIADLVSTGKTLKENNLEEVSSIMDITTRLIANKGSYQLKQNRIGQLVENLKDLV